MLIERYTSAPASYDGFGTIRTGKRQPIMGNRTLELVRIRPEHLEWQENRYGSGLHLCITPNRISEFEIRNNLNQGENKS